MPPSVLALTIVALLITPIATAAAALPAAVAMEPGTADPGETIAVTGTGFPASASVQLQLLTPEGLRYIDTVTTGDDGAFARTVTLPADAAPGAWELQATSAGAITATYAFTSTTAAAAVLAEAAETRSGNSAEDIAVMLVISVVLAAVVGGVGYVYYQLKLADMQPGMAMGDDPIWSDGKPAEAPQAATAEQPTWLKSQSDRSQTAADGQG